MLVTRGSLNAYRDLNYANKKIVDTEWSVLVPKSPFDLRAQPPSSFVLAKPPRHRSPVSSFPPFRVRVQPYPSPSVCIDFHDGTFHMLSRFVRGTVGYQAIGYCSHVDEGTFFILVQSSYNGIPFSDLLVPRSQSGDTCPRFTVDRRFPYRSNCQQVRSPLFQFLVDQCSRCPPYTSRSRLSPVSSFVVARRPLSDNRGINSFVCRNVS